jgi:hypothetical protein
MPPANRFRHQSYSAERPQAPFHVLAADAGADVGSDEFTQRMQQVGQSWREAGVERVYLVHGTFVGNDALGLWRGLSRIMPAAASPLRKLSRSLGEAVFGENGNFTQEYAEGMQRALSNNDGPSIPVVRFDWSSENNHIGRADAAIRLIDDITQLEPHRRILLWGHSHGGNVFALMSNLLSGDRESVARFFDAARAYYRYPLFRRIDLPVWESVRERLLNSERPLGKTKLDFTTFGTPIRYGWDVAESDRLLHFVHHRPAADHPPYLASFPPKADDVLHAVGGDYIHQMGIAGTNVMPPLLAPRAWLSDCRLNALLQPGLRIRDLRTHLAQGMRVAEDGTTLLIDYGEPEENITQHHVGHAVYTRSRWMLFHAEQVTQRFYDSHATG